MLRSTVQTLKRRSFSVAAFLREIEYDYSKISKIITKSAAVPETLIDVREPHEFRDGNIPTSKNIPLSRFEELLKLDPPAFKDSTGFAKPEKTEPVVFYCKAGVRSTSATKIAESLGYKQVGNYKGSWNDYTSRQSSSAGVGSQGGNRAFSSLARRPYSSKPTNPNTQDGAGEGAAGGIDLKKMNQQEEKRAEADKAEEKKGSKLASAEDGESESVKSGAELAGKKKFQ